MKFRNFSKTACLTVHAILGLFLVIFAGTVLGEGGEPRDSAIRGARIVTVSGPVIEDGTVVIANGLIQAVGKDRDVSVPSGAWVFDGKGLTVYPGLIDAGSSVGLPKPEASETAEAGSRRRGAPSTSPPPEPISMGPEDRPATAPWRVAADEIKADDKRIEAWRNAGFTTALILPGEGIVAGQASLVNLAGNSPSEMVVNPGAALQLNLRPPGGFLSGFPDSLMGVIAYLRQLFDDAAWYALASETYRDRMAGIERPRYDRAEREVARLRRQNVPLLVPANSAVEILRALKLAQEWGWPAILRGGQQSYAVASSVAAGKIPVLVDLKWPEKAKDADPEAAESLRDLRFRDRAPSSPAVLEKAGAKFAFYSGGLESTKEVWKNLRKAVDAGLSPDAVLRALTLDAAEILGAGDQLGSIEVRKIADLVVATGEPWGEKTKVKYIFVDGRWFGVHEEAPPEKPGEKKSESTVEGAGR